jgi:hypothetical protein
MRENIVVIAVFTMMSVLVSILLTWVVGRPLRWQGMLAASIAAVLVVTILLVVVLPMGGKE